MYDAHLNRIGCNHWFCPECSLSKSIALKQALQKIDLEALGCIALLVTLTLDPKRPEFGGDPAKALSLIIRRKAVAKAIGVWLRKRCPEARHRWIRVLELQQSGWPHWHVVIVVPKAFECRLPQKGPDGKPHGGEFDAFWKYGFSNVEVEQQRLGYIAKAASYICKGAGGDRPGQTRRKWLETVRASGMCSKGTHVVQACRGFWQAVGVEQPDLDATPPYDDREMVPEQEDVPADVVNPDEPVRLLVDRIEMCSTRCCLRFVDSRTGRTHFSVLCGTRRRVIGEFLKEYLGEGAVELYEGTNNFYAAPDLTRREVLELLEALDRLGAQIGGEGTLHRVASAMGCFDPPRRRRALAEEHHPPDEAPLRDADGAVKCQESRAIRACN